MRYPTASFTAGEKVSYKMQGRSGSFDAEVISSHPTCVRVKVFAWMGIPFTPVLIKNVKPKHLRKLQITDGT